MLVTLTMALSKRINRLGSRFFHLVLALWGEAGIGKSYTAQQLLKNATCKTMSVQASTDIATMLGTRGIPAKFPAMATHLFNRLINGQSLDTGQELDLLHTWLRVQAPILLLVEDLHQVKAEKLEFWTKLATTIKTCKGVGMLVTTRDKPSNVFEAVQVQALNEAEIKTLLANELGSLLPNQAVHWIQTRAAGNPLFSLEFLKHLTTLGFLWNDTKRWHWREPPLDTMPMTVEALIEQVLFEAIDTPETRLALYSRALLETRAPKLVIESELWATTAGLNQTQIDFAELDLVKCGLLTQSGFAHPLFQEVTLKQLPDAQKTVMSTRALQHLQDTQPVMAVAFLEDSHLPNQTAFSTLMACAQSVVAQPTLAAQIKARAAEYLSGSARADLLLEVLNVLIYSEPKQALDLAESVLEIPELTDQTRANAIYHATYAIVTTTRNINAAEESLKRLPISHQGTTEHIASLISYMMLCGQPARALETWESHSELHGIVQTPVLIHVLSALMLTKAFDKAESLTKEILQKPNLQDRELLSIFNIRAISLAQLGQLEESERIGLEALALAERLEQHNAVGVMLLNRALTLERSNQRSAMCDHAARAIVALQKAGNPGLAAQANLMIAVNDLESGRYETAAERLNATYSTLKSGATTPFLVSIELSLVRFHLTQDLQYSQTLALKYARDACSHAKTLAQSVLLASAQSHLSLALCQVGNLEEANSVLDKALPVLEDATDTNTFFVRFAQAKLLEASHQTANATWQLAIDKAQTQGFLFDANCYRLELARLETDLASAQALLDWFQENGLLHGVNLAKRYFPSLETKNTVSQTSQIRLEVLGTMQISGQAVRGQKRQLLLARLLEARILGQQGMTTLDLLDAIYPNEPEETAISALKQSVFKTRSSYGNFVIETTATGYALGEIGSDAELFLKTSDSNIWRGGYLEGLENSSRVSEVLYQHLKSSLNSLLKANPKETVRVCRISIKAEPYDLDAWRFLLLALKSDANHRSLKREYQTAKTRMLEIDEVLPDDWTEFLGS